MTAKLNPDDFMQFACQTINTEVNVNHNNCPAGEDRKRRLYIKRTSKGVVAYCHHCGLSGYAHSSETTKHPPVESKEDKKPYVRPSLTPITPLSPNIEWLSKYYRGRESGVVAYILATAKEDLKAVGTPITYEIKDLYGTYYGHQYRWTDGRSPKNKTYLERKPHCGSWITSFTVERILVIVEDPLSGIIVAAHGVDTLALLGTTLKQNVENMIADHGAECILVWMDDDDAGRAAADKIINRLRFVYPDRTVVGVPKGTPEPKKCFTIEGVLDIHV